MLYLKDVLYDYYMIDLQKNEDLPVDNVEKHYQTSSFAAAGYLFIVTLETKPS